MGKIANKTYINTVNSMTNSMVDRIDNNFYTFIDKAPTTVTYYNINTEKTTIDEGTAMMYSYTDKDSSIRFNKINDVVLFGIDRIAIDIDAGDFGAEGSSVEGDAYLVPNAFKPFPQDYFIINHMKDKAVFKITAVSLDTMPNGANMYKLSYKLSLMDADTTELDNLATDEYEMVVGNQGTNLSMLIRSTDYEYITRLENICNSLRAIFRSYFYSDRTQAYIFKYDDRNFYDPFMIEFILRTDCMNSPELPYLFMDHQLYMPQTFPLDYKRTFQYAVEKGKVDVLCNPNLNATLVTDQTSMLARCLEEYYYVHLYRPGAYYPISAYDDDTVRRIQQADAYDRTDPGFYKNILIEYFLRRNDKRFTEEVLRELEEFNYDRPLNELFYYLPVIIYILMDKCNLLSTDIAKRG